MRCLDRLRARHGAIAALCWSAACSPATTPPEVVDAAPDPPVSLDPCKPSPASAALVEVGQGQNEFAPLADGQMVQVERGPQGGYHIWLAVRVSNVQRSGSRTSISARALTSQTTLASYDVVFTFDPDEGGFCRLYGLRYRIDTGGVHYEDLLGTELDVTVRVTDPSGASGEGHKRVLLSSDVI